MYSDEVLWQRKMRYQKEMNKKIGVFYEECKDLSYKFRVLMKEFD
jgi:hypothetical protein